MYALSSTWLTFYSHTEKLLSMEEGERKGRITPQPGTVHVWPHNWSLEPKLTQAASNHARKRLKLLSFFFVTTKRQLFKAQTFKMWFSHNIRKELSKSVALVCCRNVPRAVDNLSPDQLETLLFLQPVGSTMSANNIFTLRKLSIPQCTEKTAAHRALNLQNTYTEKHLLLATPMAKT